MEIKVVDVQSHVFPKDYAELLCKSKSKVRGTKITEKKKDTRIKRCETIFVKFNTEYKIY